ncbi:hypothetical protein MesoLjLa_23270 [Mesorhizobium sp. L-2-11]|nr:hypothetical protein MesoLjLa_23270 [Mesorhizobium sp. L-2-11]
MRRGHGAVSFQDPSHDVAAVESAHVVDDPADFAGLRAQHAFRQISEVEPSCDWQTYKADGHCRNQERSHGALLTRNLFTQSRHCPGYRPPVIQYLNYTSFAARYQRQWLGENTMGPKNEPARAGGHPVVEVRVMGRSSRSR